MPQQSKEANILLAMEAIRMNRKLSMRRAAEMYQVSKTTLLARMSGRIPAPEKRNARHNLTLTEEETLVQYILELDARGFPPQINYVRDIANRLLAARHKKPVGKNWPYNFTQRHSKLKTRFSRAYDFQRALCENPDLINAWF